MEEMKDYKQFLESKEYLPDFLKDFHDQKDFFKAMHGLYHNRLQKDLPAFNWIDSQIYTIDFFLWYCGAHGYKLQKTRSKYRFADIKQTISRYKADAVKHLSNLIKHPTCK